MRKTLMVLGVVALILTVSTAAMAAQGTWATWAFDSTGKLTTTDSQAAYVTTSRTGPVTKVTGLEWGAFSNSSGDYAVGKGVDYSVTSGTGASAVWNINDNNSIRTNPDGNTYQKTVITPSSLDPSRGIVMAKIKVNSAYNSGINTAFGMSLGNGYGVQLGLRGGNNNWRIRDGEGGTIAGLTDPSAIDQTVFRVYAISWLGSTASVWLSNGSDWSATYTDWTKVATFTMGAATQIWDPATSTQKAANGLVLFTGSSGNQWNGDIAWMAHSTYDTWDPTVNDWTMNPWGFNPNPPAAVPEPASLLALFSGLVGVVGFARRRK